MAIGSIRKKPLPYDHQFAAVNDQRLRMSLMVLSDRYSAQVRNHIYNVYQDNQIASIWRGKRNSGIYDKGGKSKVHRKILEFPDAYIFEFLDTTMSALYGPDWLKNRKALSHELVRPWHVVSKL